MTTAASAPAPPAPERVAEAHYAFDGRMAEWTNDDLLLTEAQRDLIEASHPGLLAVIDMPELRKLFASFDATANAARRRRQRIGMTAILVAGLGAAFSAIMPLVELLGGFLSRPLFALAALLSLLAFVWTVGLTLADREKDSWLQHRLRTERLRQFYFQFLISDPALAILAWRDPAALAAWQQRKDQAIKLFGAWAAREMRVELEAVRSDVNLRQAWFMDAWRSAPPADAGADLDAYLLVLRRQRLGIQRAYVREKLASGLHSPETRLALAQFTSWGLTIVTLLLTIGCSLLMWQDWTWSRKPILYAALLSTIALCGVLAMLARVVSEGLQLRADRDRYSWYRDAIVEIDGHFNNPDPAARIAALREFEVISYREMCEFLKTHGDARFSLV